MNNALYHKNWRVNANKGAEAITLLDLLSVLEQKEKSVSSGKVIAVVDNSKVCRSIISNIAKPRDYTDVGAEIAQMKRLLKKMRFEVEFKLVRGQKTPIGPF